MDEGEEVVEFSLGKIQLNLVQLFERLAKVNQDQISLVAEFGQKRGLDGRVRIRFLGGFTLQALKR
jgi:phosphosulfolactate synthase (CoM biosynthesis protein A)